MVSTAEIESGAISTAGGEVTPLLFLDYIQTSLPLSIQTTQAGTFPVEIDVKHSCGMAEITATPAGGIAPHQYLWSNGDTSSRVERMEPGWHSVIITDLNGTSVTMDNIEVKVNPPCPCERPEGVTVLATGDSSAVVNWEESSWAVATQFQYRVHPVSSLNSSGSMVIAEGITSTTLNRLLPGIQYQMRLRHNCGNVMGLSGWRWKNFLMPALRTSEQKTQLHLYPNPASIDIGIGVYSKTKEIAQMSVFNSRGNKINGQDLQLMKGWNRTTIDVSQLPAGLYYLEVKGNHTKLNESFEVVRE